MTKLVKNTLQTSFALLAKTLLVKADLGRLGPHQTPLPPKRNPHPLHQSVLHQANRLEFLRKQAQQF